MKKIIALATSIISAVGLSLSVSAVPTNINVNVADKIVAPTSTTVEVPVYVGCSDLAGLNLNFKMDNYSIKEIKTNISGMDTSATKGTIIYVPFASAVNTFDIQNEFLRLVVEIPQNTPYGTKISVGFTDELGVDASDKNFVVLNPVVKKGELVVGLKGDANLDQTVSTTDVVEMLNYINASNLGENYDKVSTVLGNVDESLDGLATNDAVKTLNYINALNLASDPTTVTWDSILK